MFTLNIETDNDAFIPDAHSEVARILRKLADKIESDGCLVDSSILRDVNGNTVGCASLT